MPSDLLRQGGGVDSNHLTNATNPANQIEQMDTQDIVDADSTVVNAAGDITSTETMETDPKIDSGVKDADTEDGSRSEATFRFVVQDFSKFKESVLSPPTYVRNLPWKIMVLQRQSSERPPSKALGFFLQCNGDTDVATWTCYAQADLRLISHRPDVPVFSRTINHTFFSKENDWGFSHFMLWSDIFEKGYVKDDSITLEVHVKAEAPHGVQWDSKKYTGYVGLKNQGATCYMNSLLQTLYFTNELRKAVYKMPTEADDSTKSVALALQRVFHELQFTDKPVGTKKLTKSFGWETLDSFMQHDVQEFLRVLLDKLESKMKGTCVEGTVPKLFEGKMFSYIKCKNVDYVSNREETFYDIQLNIKGKKNIIESFEDYINSETLEGDNKYDAGEHGLQDAEKGVTFKSFPPVLHLHLMRFQYDPITDCSVKFNDRFEFAEVINLDRFLQAPESTPADYHLQAVLVHSGDNHGGHYVVFLNPKCTENGWNKFDDDVVSRCTRQEAIDNNFGGQDEEVNVNAVRHCTNAYMLVYIRKSQLSTVLQEVTLDDIPSELIDRLTEEKRLDGIRRKERSESHLYMNVNVYLEDSFEGHQGVDLLEQDHALGHVYRVIKQTPVVDVMKIIADNLGCREDQIRAWPLRCRTNQTNRPSFFDMDADGKKSVAEVNENQPNWSIFLEVLPADSELKSLPSFDNKAKILVFFKYYDPKANKVHYAGHHYVSLAHPLNDIVPMLNTRAGLAPDTPLVMYEELRAYDVEEIKSLTEPLEKVLEEPTNGDIILFQKAEYSNCKQYFRDLSLRVEVLFADKLIPNDPGFTLNLLTKMGYDQIAQAVAERVGTDPYHLQFYKSTAAYKETAGQPIKCNFDGTLKDLVMGFKQRQPRKLFYQKLSIRVNELESKQLVKLTWVGPYMKEERELTLYVNKNGTVADLLKEAKKQPEISESAQLRLFEVSNGKIVGDFVKPESPLDCVNTANTTKSFRVEEIPADELHLEDNECLVPCGHFNKEIHYCFGIPFFVKLRDNEPYATVRERIQKKLDVPDKEFEKYRLAIVNNRGMPTVRHVDSDELVNLSEFQQLNPNDPKIVLGLDHVNKTPKRSRLQYLEKAIKIYN